MHTNHLQSKGYIVELNQWRIARASSHFALPSESAAQSNKDAS